jgi:DNA-binding MarR family transcriptional regulator
VSSHPPTPEAFIGALLRYPARAVQRRILARLNAAGFDDLRPPHMAVFQHPGPDGARPGELAERAGASKQAMNRLLGSLEGLGYLERRAAPGRAAVVRLTARGRDALAAIVAAAREVEEEWAAELGRERLAQLKAILLEVWDSPLVGDPRPEPPGR